MNHQGDLIVSGDVLNPAGGAVLVNTGAVDHGYATRGYHDISIILQTTIAATFIIGEYNPGGSAVNTFKFTVLGTQSSFITLKNVPITTGNSFKISNAGILIGTANVALNISCNSGD